MPDFLIIILCLYDCNSLNLRVKKQIKAILFFKVTIENSSTIDRNNIIMSPNTRQRKSRLAKDLSKYIEDWNLNEDDQVDVLALTLNKMGLLDRFKYLQKPTSKGRKLTSHETRNAAWKFWHKNSIPSTNTSRPAKLRVSDVKKIQAGLDFNDTVRVIKQRNRNFFESCWYITNEPYKVLFNKYIAEHPDNVLSFGSFVALKPFYVRAATLKDIEMCCCKVHLHARWSLGALIESSAKQNITLCFEDYYSFFEVLTADCQPEEYTHVSWKCVDKSNLCPHMATKWENMSAEILGQSNENITVKLQEFVMLETTLKNGKTVERLKAVTNDVNLKYIVNFISDLLPIIIHHRNHLKHYRNTSKIFKESFDAVCYLDIDFSENLTIPVKYEPQSLHWSHEQVTIHSGIVKTSQSKEYHPYISNDRKHDQQFVHICLQKMLENVTLTPQSYIAIESDNCSSQYKSCAHFYLIQQLSNDLNVNIIRIYGIAGHGKGEVDHVGGLAKTAVRKEVARGEFFQNAEELVDFLQEDLVSRDQLTYDVKEIKENELVDLRAECRLKVFETLDGSSQFQVMLFKPNCKKVHVAERLCVCESCLEQYGTCSSFKEVELDVRQLKTTALRSHTEKDVTDEEIDKEFILPGSICAIAANEKSIDTVWFVKIIAEEETSQNEIIDDYGFKIIPGQKFFTGNFLEKVSTKRNKQLYKEVNNKIAYVYKASIVYPFVNVEKEKGLFSIADNELCEIIAYVEHYGLTTMN